MHGAPFEMCALSGVCGRCGVAQHSGSGIHVAGVFIAAHAGVLAYLSYVLSHAWPSTSALPGDTLRTPTSHAWGGGSG